MLFDLMSLQRPSLKPSKSTVVMLLLIITTIGFATTRVFTPAQGLDLTGPTIFKDIAHVFVGGLFGAAIYAKRDWLLWSLAVGLTAVEVAAAVLK